MISFVCHFSPISKWLFSWQISPFKAKECWQMVNLSWVTWVTGWRHGIHSSPRQRHSQQGINSCSLFVVGRFVQPSSSLIVDRVVSYTLWRNRYYGSCTLWESHTQDSWWPKYLCVTGSTYSAPRLAWVSGRGRRK